MKRRAFVALAAASAAGLGPGRRLHAQSYYRLLRIGTGAKAGVYYSAGGAICHLVNEARWESGIRCLAESTEGSIANLKALRAGTLDFAIVQSDAQYHALTGTGGFSASGPFDDLRAVFSLYPESFTVVARRDAEVHTFTDLAGRRVNIGNPGSGQRQTMEAVMSVLGWTNGTLSLAAEFPPSGQAEALCRDQVDAIVFTVGNPNQSIYDAVVSCGAELVPLTGPVIDRVVSGRPYFRAVTIAGGTYPGNPEDVRTFGMLATLVTTERSDMRSVYQLVKSVFTHLPELRAAHPALAALTKRDMVHDGLTAPLHPGALLYYAQAGLITSR